MWETETKPRGMIEKETFKMVVLFVFGLLLIISKRRMKSKTVCANAAAAAAAALGLLLFHWMEWEWEWEIGNETGHTHSFQTELSSCVCLCLCMCAICSAMCAQQPQNIWQTRKSREEIMCNVNTRHVLFFGLDYCAARARLLIVCIFVRMV